MVPLTNYDAKYLVLRVVWIAKSFIPLVTSTYLHIKHSEIIYRERLFYVKGCNTLVRNDSVRTGS